MQPDAVACGCPPILSDKRFCRDGTRKDGDAGVEGCIGGQLPVFEPKSNGVNSKVHKIVLSDEKGEDSHRPQSFGESGVVRIASSVGIFGEGVRF